MGLGELIEYLDDLGDTTMPIRLENPHSYRGYYECLAFEVVNEPATARQNAAVARSARGATYYGWKGGEFAMTTWTEVYAASEGSTGEPVTRLWLDAITRPRSES